MAESKAATLWIVNVASSILFAVLALTGLTNWLLLPHGRSGAGGLLVSARHVVREVHEWTALLFIIAVIVHVALHWTYVKRNLKKSGVMR